MFSRIIARSRRRRARARATSTVLPALVTGALVIGVVAVSPAESTLEIRRLLGFDDERLVAAPQIREAGGSYEFMQTQKGSGEPVGYDPCRPIEVAVNPTGAPDYYDELVDTGLARTAAATGLQFVRVGLTDERDITSGGLARRRPVLIAWATPSEVPELAGDVAGIGGSIAFGQPGALRYVKGKVILDRDYFAALGPDERSVAQAVVDHELGHLVGLAHVDDPGELMYGESLARTSFGPGDLEGLARLGNVDC